MHFIMKPGRAGCTVALAHTQGHAGARAARTYHWSLENEMMKRMPAGSRAIYTWTSELWPRNQMLHKEISNPGSQSLCLGTRTVWEGSGDVLFGSCPLLLSAEA